MALKRCLEPGVSRTSCLGPVVRPLAHSGTLSFPSWGSDHKLPSSRVTMAGRADSVPLDPEAGICPQDSRVPSSQPAPSCVRPRTTGPQGLRLKTRNNVQHVDKRDLAAFHSSQACSPRPPLPGLLRRHSCILQLSAFSPRNSGSTVGPGPMRGHGPQPRAWGLHQPPPTSSCRGLQSQPSAQPPSFQGWTHRGQRRTSLKKHSLDHLSDSCSALCNPPPTKTCQKPEMKSDISSKCPWASRVSLQTVAPPAEGQHWPIKLSSRSPLSLTSPTSAEGWNHVWKPGHPGHLREQT